MSLSGPNIVLFVGASKLFCDATHILREERPRRVEVRAISMLCLLIDGCPIPAGMPLANRPPKGAGYKEPHFAAVCFDLPGKDSVG